MLIKWFCMRMQQRNNCWSLFLLFVESVEALAEDVPAKPVPSRCSSKRSRAAKRRSRINEKMKALQHLSSNSIKTDLLLIDSVNRLAKMKLANFCVISSSSLCMASMSIQNVLVLQIYKLELEQKRLEGDAFVYNSPQQ
ncbi:hypothetical protein AAHE18_04G103900 [Arachis hypogaea]